MRSNFAAYSFFVSNCNSGILRRKRVVERANTYSPGTTQDKTRDLGLEFCFSRKPGKSLTVICADTAASHVGRVVVEGDVPLPAAGPTVEHHDVVLRPADQEVGVLQVRALLIRVRRLPRRPRGLASVERDRAVAAAREPVHCKPSVHLWNVKMT